MKKRYTKEFINLYRKQYNQIHWLGRIINQSRREQAPESHIAKLERKFDRLINEQRKFMDDNHCKLTKPKWQYDIYDKTTWASSLDFEHADKIEYPRSAGA
jgi:hypothetical protein